MTDERHGAEERLRELIAQVQPTDATYEKLAWERLDSLTKPPRSLGALEHVAARIARIQRTDHPSVPAKAIILAAGDHGVVAEGVSPFPQDVTWQMVANFAHGGAAVNQIAASVGAEVVVYDVGVARDVSELPGVVDAKVRCGTRNMAEGPAMTREECAEAILAGAQAASELVERGVSLIGTGEMGIGNSTAAAALTAVFCASPVAEVVGRGTGLSDEGVAHKAEVIGRAIAVNGAAELDPLGVLSALGGLEIAALTGVILSAAAQSVPVLCDGFISGSAALAAVALAPAAADYIVASHLSAEPGHAVVLRQLGIEPVLKLDMRLGEGTGAALAMGIVDASCRMMSGMATFEEAGVSGSEA